MSALSRDWDRLLAEHSAALEEFVLTCRQVPADHWCRPVGPEKWTPAEITCHLIESYRVLAGELAGAPGMQLRLGPVKRWLLRRTVLPRILDTGTFPAGARAPRETRPRDPVPEQDSAIPRLMEESEAFIRELSQRAPAGRVRMTHAYFGSMSARQGLRLVAVHIRHHQRQLAASLKS